MSISNISKGATITIPHDLTVYTYRVFDIKSGGMGIVFILDKEKGAWNAVFQQMIALKTFKREYASSINQQLFERELNIWIVLEHKNVLPLRKILTQENDFLAVMPFCEGSLRHLISESQDKLNKTLAIQVVSQVITGLEYAYNEYKILHLDIKPENILFEFINDKTYRISDWGISKLQASFVQAVHSNVNGIAETYGNFGTLPYMSPERLLGHPNNISFDVYSIGIMFYEIIFGCLPFNDLSMQHIHSQILNGDYYEKAATDLKKIGDNRVANIILNCLNPDYKHRYDSYAEVRNDLSMVAG
ncbi:MAG: serine/threonine-protein kinase [Thermodesulfovibrionales bacterium]